MIEHKTFFIPTEQQESKGKVKITVSHKVEGLALSRSIQALLQEHEQHGYELASMQSVVSTAGQFTYTEGMVVVLKKKM